MTLFVVVRAAPEVTITDAGPVKRLYIVPEHELSREPQAYDLPESLFDAWCGYVLNLTGMSVPLSAVITRREGCEFGAVRFLTAPEYTQIHSHR